MKKLPTSLRSLYTNSSKQAKLFLVIASPVLLVLTFISPPMQAPDESQHYLRAYTLSKLDFNTKELTNSRFGALVPETVSNFVAESTSGRAPYANGDPAVIKKYLSAKAEGSPVAVYFDNTAINFPLAYVPQILGIMIGNLLDLPLLFGFYLGRLLSALVFIIIVFLAHRITPYARWTLLCISLLPMTLYQASSLSSDSLLISLSLLAVALILKFYQTKNTSTKQLLILGGVVLCLSLIKQVYVLLLLPILFAPKKFYINKSSRIIILTLISSVCLIAAATWNFSVSDIANGIHNVYRPEQDIVPGERLVHLLTQPFSFAIDVFLTLFFYSSEFLIQSTIGIVGWLDIKLPAFCYFILFSMLILSVLQDANQKYVPSKRLRLILLVTASLMVVSTCALLYIGYTSADDTYINGLQGRYFIPILAILLPALITPIIRTKIDEKIFSKIITTVYAIALLTMLFVIIDTNYTGLLFRS